MERLHSRSIITMSDPLTHGFLAMGAPRSRQDMTFEELS